MLTWVLTNGKENIISSRNGNLSIDESVIIKSISSLIGEDSSSGYAIERFNLPTFTIFYKKLVKEVDIPYVLFIKARKSMELEKIESVFNEVSILASKYKYNDEFSDECVMAFSTEINGAVDKVRQNKVLIMGYAGVGKTTIRNLLRGKELPLTHVPTIGVEVVNLTEDLLLWDTAGQVGYLQLLPHYIRGSDLVVVVSDSTLENALLTKRLVTSLKKMSDTKFVLVANKQDSSVSLTPERISQIIGISQFMGLTALEFNQRAAVLKFLNESLKV